MPLVADHKTSRHHMIDITASSWHDCEMRTTLTLDDDVAALLKRAMSRRNRSLKDIVNDVLRDGLARQMSARAQATRFETRGRDLGRCLVPNLDNIAHVLGIAEGEDYK
jgi:hypothetical protein